MDKNKTQSQTDNVKVSLNSNITIKSNINLPINNVLIDQNIIKWQLQHCIFEVYFSNSCNNNSINCDSRKHHIKQNVDQDVTQNYQKASSF